MSDSLVIYCRPGLENDAVAELMARLPEVGAGGFARARPDTGWLSFQLHDGLSAQHVMTRLAFGRLVFVRQWFCSLAHLTELPVDDRVSPLAAVFGDRSLSDVWVEHPDTNEGKSLSKLARGLEGHLQRRLLRDSRRVPQWRGHVLLLSGTEAWVGVTPTDNSARWPLGYPRLRFPREAPSRSTLKLEEAWHVLLGEDTECWPRVNQRAVDLGAAPGGWTWQLVQRGLRVTAIDNGPMDARVMEEGRVIHLREDAFAWKPPTPVDWMVCDVVEQPAKVLSLVERWLVREWCKQTIFNLKLPMKKRFQEVSGLLDRLAASLDAAGMPYTIRARQLYHDREEVTVWVGPEA